MKNFRQFVKELPSNKVVVAFGAFQPPTSIHEHLVKAVKRVADDSADYAIYASANEDKKHNPLSVDRKIYFLNRMFPGTKFQETKEQTIVGLAKKLNEKYRNLVVVVGEDKVSETEKQLNKANGKEFIFESIKVVSTGNTDPDSDLSSGVSGLRMCKSAKDGNFEDFKKGLPHTLTEHDSRRLMNEVRKGLGQDVIKEVVEFTRSTVREQYIAGKIFNVGDKVQDDMGVYEIMDRGANYLTVVNESGELTKKWIDKVTVAKVTESTNIVRNPNEFTFKGYTTTQFHKEPRALKAFKGTVKQHEDGSIKDGVAILNAIKHTDAYLNMVDGKDHGKAQEALNRIGQFGRHEKYWDDHKPTIKNVVSKQKKDQEVPMSSKNVHEAADPAETKKIMLRYKDFIKTATTSELPVEIGVPAGDTGKKDTESTVDTAQMRGKVGHTLNHGGNNTLRKQQVHYHLGEDIYTSDTKTKDYMTKDKDGNWVWRKRKIHPKRVTFAASEMGGDPFQQAQQDEEYVSEAADVPAHEHPYNRPHDEPSVSHTKLKAGQHARAPYNRIVFGCALSKMWHAKNKSGQVKAFVNSDAAKKHALSEETKTYGSWILRQKSMISKSPVEKSKKKVTKGKTSIADKEAFDAKNAGGTPPFDPFF
jgi:hypothetical protein